MEALTVVKAPVNGVVAPIAPCKPVLVTEAFSTPLIFNEWLLASKIAGRKVVWALSKNTKAVPLPEA